MHEISPQTLKDLARPIPFLSLLAVASNWLFLAGILFLNHFSFHPLLLSLSFLFIGRIQVAYLGLTHEATHLRIHPSRRINDAVGQYFCASPLFFSLHVYRAMHFKHHRNPLGPEDPDLSLTGGYPMVEKRFLKKLMRDLLGISYGKLVVFMMGFSAKTKKYREKLLAELQQNGESNCITTNQVVFSGIASNLLILGYCWLLGSPILFLLLWILPLFSITQVFLRIRGIAEHAGFKESLDQRLNTRTVLNSLQAFFLAPYQLQYHIEHHLYPSVPFYRLRKLHRLLAKKGQMKNIHSGYGSVLKELLVSNP